MLDPDGDDIWTITVEQPPGALLKYKFANGPVPNWAGNWENVPSACQSEDPDNTDRWVMVGETDTMVDTVCFGSCENCITNYPVDVTFNLDMSTEQALMGLNNHTFLVPITTGIITPHLQCYPMTMGIMFSLELLQI